ncbi:hypothetical protein E2C01_084695 [Portunus trituberculatus]|uniref:Uncharacterized protein n=1 Tax=Portunus trituberculatus TaxID=210409 RepID=A0A5B7J6X1_PORTR|nr:hypothetical protein [Portunus trituberculatus]
MDEEGNEKRSELMFARLHTTERKKKQKHSKRKPLRKGKREREEEREEEPRQVLKNFKVTHKKTTGDVQVGVAVEVLRGRPWVLRDWLLVCEHC